MSLLAPKLVSRLVRSQAIRQFSAYPINDAMFGLTEDEIAVGFQLPVFEESFHFQFRRSLRQFTDKELSPFADKIDKNDGWDQQRPFWRKLGAQGLLGITAPVEYGGSGMNYFANVLANEEMTRASGSMGLSYTIHSNLCVNQIVLNASDEQKKKYLPKVR